VFVCLFDNSNDPQQLIERSIREQITIVQDNINELQKMSGDLEDDQKNLRSKIERKATELERAEKRLATLRQVRPAFMDEYEHMENELKSVYEVPSPSS
jgi:clusterin-associated protein 1